MNAIIRNPFDAGGYLLAEMTFGVPEVLFLDLPQMSDSIPAHQPLIAADAQPWPGEMAVFHSPALDGFSLLTTFGQRVKIGTLAADSRCRTPRRNWRSSLAPRPSAATRPSPTR